MRLHYGVIHLIPLFMLSGCTEEETPISMPISTDISVTTSASSITWIDQNDLLQKLNTAIVFNTGDAKETEVDKSMVFASDTSQVTASIDFKEAYKSQYSDPNPANNSATIALTKDPGQSNAVVLSADGAGNTYNLITSVLAPGHDPIETPDCGHQSFGDHIDEVFDNDLNTNVFRFMLHTTPDNDRCINFDRQRNEIKTYDKSPDNLLGVENETVVYKWKFKLPSGFQSSPKFTHIHQLKSAGGNFSSMPLYTLTTRKGSPDRLELRYAETTNQITLAQTDIAPLIGVWLEVTETIKYGTTGTYDITIKRHSDGTVLFQHAENNIINWRPGGTFVRPKWGIYRSLVHVQDLRDESLLFNDFSIEEL